MPKATQCKKIFRDSSVKQVMTVRPFFYSIKNRVESEIKIKRSRFICRLIPASDIESARRFISETSKARKTATHNCWAYIIGEDQALYHSSDAGEPSGTAGKPMLNVLFHHQLTDIAAVVTRYFGGVKLGVRGLMDAYAESVESAVDMAVRIRRVERIPYVIELGYEDNDAFLNRIREMAVSVEATDYTDRVTHDIQVAADDQKEMDELLTAYQAKGLIRLIRCGQKA